MTFPPEPSTRLDDLERRARDLAAHPPSDLEAWRRLLADIESSPSVGPSLLDEARQSEEELRLLALTVLRRPPVPWTSPPTSRNSRAGYTIESERGSREVRVRPSFAESLARLAPEARLQREFPDLWAVDLGLWHQLAPSPPDSPAIALTWLTSPGRRLVQDLSPLEFEPEARSRGAADFSFERIRAAAGHLGSAEHRETDRSWFELHTAVPGAALDRWRPATHDVSSVLRMLEGRRGDPVFLRGAALAWLLDRAATTPFYDLEGLQRDLREDLLLAFINGFPDDADVSRHVMLQAAIRLETVCLLHAARFSAHSPSSSTSETWGLARWLQSCTFRSPSFGGDEEALAARLRALLPRVPAEPERPLDILDPRSFEDEGEGLDVSQLALVAGAARHYWPGAKHPQFLPTPLPLVHALRRVASRPLNAGERHAEHLLRRFHTPPVPPEPGASPAEKVENDLGWSAPHVAPPLLARWLMTHQRISWLEHASAEAQRESLRFFEEEPARYEWVAFAIYAEGPQLTPDLRQDILPVWSRVVSDTHGQLGAQGALALMAVGILDQLPDEDARRVVSLARDAKPDWRHHAFEALAEMAEKHRRPEPWHSAMDGLWTMCLDETLGSQERLRAALLMLRRASASTWPERIEFLQRLASLVHRTPFDQNVPLRRELRRLGLLDSRGAR